MHSNFCKGLYQQKWHVIVASMVGQHNDEDYMPPCNSLANWQTIGEENATTWCLKMLMSNLVRNIVDYNYS